MCARTAGGIHKTAGKKKGILLFRGSGGKRVKISPKRGQTLAPHTGVPSLCSTNVLLNNNNNCKGVNPAEGDHSQGQISIQELQLDWGQWGPPSSDTEGLGCAGGLCQPGQGNPSPTGPKEGSSCWERWGSAGRVAGNEEKSAASSEQSTEPKLCSPSQITS